LGLLVVVACWMALDSSVTKSSSWRIPLLSAFLSYSAVQAGSTFLRVQKNVAIVQRKLRLGEGTNTSLMWRQPCGQRGVVLSFCDRFSLIYLVTKTGVVVNGFGQVPTTCFCTTQFSSCVTSKKTAWFVCRNNKVLFNSSTIALLSL